MKEHLALLEDMAMRYKADYMPSNIFNNGFDLF
jgi:hypothetical protein